jgi:hypothetical protein
MRGDGVLVGNVEGKQTEIVSKGKGEKVKCWFGLCKVRKTKRGTERRYIET